MKTQIFRRAQPLPLRIWHWASGTTILALLGTVYLRGGFLSARKNAALIVDDLKTTVPTLTLENVKPVAEHLRDNMFQWHYYLGLFLAALFIFRLFFGGRSILPRPQQDFLKGKHYGLVKISYGAFYGVLTYMVLSGVSMYVSGELHWFKIPESIFEAISEVHEFAQWFFVVFILGHLAGVIFAENSTDPGIVSDMIHGKKED